MWQFNLNACLLMFFVSFLNVSGKDEVYRRIIGGVKAEEIPWFVTIYANARLCGGSAITKLAVVTAAHCFNNLTNVDNMIILVGKDEERIKNQKSVKSVIVHPQFFQDKNEWSHNDIAVVFVQRPFDFDVFATWIWPPPDLSTKVWVAGFGGTVIVDPTDPQGPKQIYARELRKSLMELMDHEKCKTTLKPATLVDDEQLCTSPDTQRPCHGDSGGPLFGVDKERNHFVLYGIISGGLGCTDNWYPHTHTRIASYQLWIHDTLFCKFKFSGIWRDP